jgi:hypothetical protein
MAVISLCGTRNPVLSGGSLRIRFDGDDDGRTLRDLPGNVLCRVASMLSGEDPDPHARLAVLHHPEATSAELYGWTTPTVPEPWIPAVPLRTKREPDGSLTLPPANSAGRPAAGSVVRSYERLSACLNTTDPALLSAYPQLAYGTALPKSLPMGLPDDALKSRAFNRAPPTRHVRSNVSRLIMERYESADCWFLDMGPCHVADFEGNRVSRLGVDWHSGYAQLSVSDNAGSASLVAQLDDIIRLSRQRAGRSPSVFRMDFGAEAAEQGRGDN